MTEIKLNLCPLCGGMPEIFRFAENTEFESWSIMCSNSDCMLETVKWYTLEDAAKAWNRREGEVTEEEIERDRPFVEIRQNLRFMYRLTTDELRAINDKLLESTRERKFNNVDR